MSPEQASGEVEVDGRSDVYSLGAVLYEMLAGAPVYSAVNARALMARHALDPIPSVCVVRPGVPRSVDAAIQRALAKTPADRFASAAAFAEALAAGDSTLRSGDAQAPNVDRAVTPAWRRPRFISLTAAVVSVALVAGWAVQRAKFSPMARSPATAAVGQPLTFSGWARQPAFSPDGRQLLYVERTCDGAGTCESALTVRDVGSDQSAILAKGEFIVRPWWSPDGTNIAFAMQNGEDLGTYVLPRLGGVPRKVGPMGMAAEFSADGDTLSVIDGRSTKVGFARLRVRPATGALIDSSSLALPLTFLQTFSTSPDRRWIIAYGFGSCGSCLLLASPDGRVADSAAVDPLGRVRWDPRGDAVYAVVAGAGLNAWFVRMAVDPRRGQFTQRVDTLFSVPAVGLGQFDIAPDGRSIVYGGGTTTTTLWALDLNDSTATPLQLAKTTSYLSGAVLSSDGELVAYGTTDRLGDNLYVKPFRGGPATPVTQDSAATAVYSTLGWYPRSHRLSYVGWNDKERQPLFQSQDLPHGARRRMRAPGPGILPILLADGGVAEYDHQRVITFRDSAGKEIGSVTLPDSLGAAVIPAGEDIDGTGVLFSTGNASEFRMRLVRVDRRSGRITLIGTIPTAGAWATAVLSGGIAGATYATWPRGARTGIPTLWRVTPGRPNTRLRDLPITCDVQLLVASSDGKRLVCISSDEHPDIFLLEQFDRYRR
jgi:WD40 repeat protein